MKAKVLLVEDDRDLLLAMSMLLRARGHVIATASDGSTAMTAIRRFEPDIVLLDLGLPGGDGLDVLTRMRGLENTVAIPVVVLTARDESYRDICMRSGAQAFFRKPANEEQLLATIDRLTSDELEIEPSLDRLEALAVLRQLFETTAVPAPSDAADDDQPAEAQPVSHSPER